MSCVPYETQVLLLPSGLGKVPSVWSDPAPSPLVLPPPAAASTQGGQVELRCWILPTALAGGGGPGGQGRSAGGSCLCPRGSYGERPEGLPERVHGRTEPRACHISPRGHICRGNVEAWTFGL